jgi:general secretion pathway protein A
MVLKYYKLAEQPFGVTPDPRFLYLSATHREAMASVLHSVRSGRGFTALIAEPGMGKTTVLFNLLQQLGSRAKTAFLFQAQDTPRNFLRNLLLDLGIEDDGQDLVRMQVRLNECLVRETSVGKHFIVVVDEAQNLDEPVLEVVRMLSNFETSREKLMHIILAGQPRLAGKLASPQLKQLRQRVSIVAQLKPFDADETRAYIEHRLSVAGYRAEEPLFTDRAFALIATYSGGIPRNINNICFNAMSLGCTIKRKTIHAVAVEEVLNDLDLAPLTSAAPISQYHARSVAPAISLLRRLTEAMPKRWALTVAIIALVGLLAGFGWALGASNLRLAPPTPANQATHPEIVQPAALVPASTPAPTAVRADSASLSSSNVQQPAAQSAASAALTVDSADKSGADDRENHAAVNSPTIDSTTVQVSHEDTLYEICVNNFGRYDSQIVAMIRELNPGLDPRHIRSGQELRIPTPGSLSARTNPSPESVENTPALEANKR